MALEPDRRPLPDGIKLETLKAHAKALRKAFQAGDQSARQRVEPYFDDPATLKLQQAQLVVARTHGFDSWRKLRAFIDARDGRRAAERKLSDLQGRIGAEGSQEPSFAELEATSKSIDGFVQRMSRASGELHCSFCLKPGVASELVAGPEGFICKECVGLCMEIIKASVPR